MEAAAADPVPAIAAELALDAGRIRAVLALLAEGNTVPFIARYRKERTGEMDELQIRAVRERHVYLQELEARRQAVLAAVAKQGKLDDALRSAILAADTKAALEDLYRPFKPRRRTRGTRARSLGLAPLAERILAQPADGDPVEEARAFVHPARGVPDVAAALDGARDIVAETIAERPALRARLRPVFLQQGVLRVTARDPDQVQHTKFARYAAYREPVDAIPSHRYLAVRRGEREKQLRLGIEVDTEALVGDLLRHCGHRPGSPFGSHLAEAVADAFARLLAPSLENEVHACLKERSDRVAVEVFASNLRGLLMAAPLGERPVIGIDPGIRTGCKCAVLDATGRFLDHRTIYPLRSAAERERAGAALLDMMRAHEPVALAVGNGTGGRETEAFAREVLHRAGLDGVWVVPVNESGASVYSASALAGREFPDLDLTVRGAISIGRRLQDPLAELVKIDPASIGVGQYQHDVQQKLLGRKLDEVVESVVNQVGVELNTASALLLARVAGIGPGLAEKIVARREREGAFGCRADLLQVGGLGPRAFQQAAGFLRVRGGTNPLDRSGVHPERTGLVERMAADLGVALADLVGDPARAGRIDPARYQDDEVGLPTLRDILAELAKPGRDPRAEFEPPRFRDDVHTIEDLSPGMRLEGVVTNVTRFGAFVDVGVHQDGLVHISELADRFVKDPQQVVQVGQRLQVRVLGVEPERKRISLSCRTPQDKPRPRPAATSAERTPRQDKKAPAPPRDANRPFRHNPFSTIGKNRKQ